MAEDILIEALELASRYFYVPTQEEFEASKLLSIQDQDKWDRKYMTALKVQRAKEIVCYPGY